MARRIWRGRTISVAQLDAAAQATAHAEGGGGGGGAKEGQGAGDGSRGCRNSNGEGGYSINPLVVRVYYWVNPSINSSIDIITVGFINRKAITKMWP